MNIIDKLERKFGKYAIQNLMIYIIILNLATFIFYTINSNMISYLELDPTLIMKGQVWRLITYIIIPPLGQNFIFTLIAIYFYYFIGTGLEKEWGSFKFNLYFP
jgi:membrane associated rhomboid family serine protease